jgi:hypothetical protein
MGCGSVCAITFKVSRRSSVRRCAAMAASCAMRLHISFWRFRTTEREHC